MIFWTKQFKTYLYFWCIITSLLMLIKVPFLLSSKSGEGKISGYVDKRVNRNHYTLPVITYYDENRKTYTHFYGPDQYGKKGQNVSVMYNTKRARIATFTGLYFDEYLIPYFIIYLFGSLIIWKMYDANMEEKWVRRFKIREN